MSGCNGGGPFNSFAVVAYVPEPLAGFIDRLRRHLEPECPARAHVTILPPRSISCSPDAAWEQLREIIQSLPPFCVELQQVEIFSSTDVIYLSIGSGFHDLQCLHRDLNLGLCRSEEAWTYWPHITLARPSEGNGLRAQFDLAVRCWSEFKYPRSFMLEEVTFVQNAWGDHWRDLERYRLEARPVASR
ncbi:MAG TPA: 2'-5' RNA ligase family protein [Bryobacteraceae bacterium]|jgi:2'-5' RNA ligase